MMFLLRAAFWVSIVLILLPTGSKKPAADLPQIKAADAASAATAAVADLSNFCTRQPESCAVGSQIAVALGQRAEAGVQTVYHFITERHEATPAQQTAASEQRANDRADSTGSIAAKGRTTSVVLLPRPRPSQTPSHDTLTASDRMPSWRAPELRLEALL